jgi:hypothetical protein
MTPTNFSARRRIEVAPIIYQFAKHFVLPNISLSANVLAWPERNRSKFITSEQHIELSTNSR